MVKINTILKDYLKLKTKKRLSGIKEVKDRNQGVITFQALAKKNTPLNSRSIYGTKKIPRIHIATLTSKGDVFLFKSDWKYIK